MGRVFLEYGTHLRAVSSFQYLVQTLSSSEDNWPVVQWNLCRAQVKWGRLVKIFGREGADRRTVGMFYVMVVHAVFLFVS